MIEDYYDAIVIGSGPAGHNAALTAASLGARTLIIERETRVGGACVQYGTIPSKTLRETAVTLCSFSRRSGSAYQISQREDLKINSLMAQLHKVIEAHQRSSRRQLESAGIDITHGQAEFQSPTTLSIRSTNGQRRVLCGEQIFIAAGSRPRKPTNIPIDHENIFDSDSLLSMTYLPQSLVVVGAGVIACEYASTFAKLGVKVVMVDKSPTPLSFLDADLVAGFTEQFVAYGGRFIGGDKVATMEWDGIGNVITRLESGETIASDKAFVAQGRVANTDTLKIANAGLQLTDRGHIPVNEVYQTKVNNIFAIGDVIGPPSLASTSVHQGRKAARHACSGSISAFEMEIPIGIYTIPEIASVGLTQSQALKDGISTSIGRADFCEVARGQIMSANGGFLKLVADERGNQILGIQIIGEGAAELVHVGQLAMRAELTVAELAATNFNFPTLAEAYRMAALDIVQQSNPIEERMMLEQVAQH